MSTADGASGTASSSSGSTPPGAAARVSDAILSETAEKLNTEHITRRKALYRTQRAAANAKHDLMRMIISNPRQQLISLVMRGTRAQWRVCDQYGGRPSTFMGLTTRLAQLFFNQSDDSGGAHFEDTEDVEPITVGPIMGDDNGDAHHAPEDVVHSRQHRRHTTHKAPRVARDTSNGGADRDIHASSNCKCRGIEHGRLVHEELMQLILQWNGGRQFSVRLDNTADATRRVCGRGGEYELAYPDAHSSSSSADGVDYSLPQPQDDLRDEYPTAMDEAPLDTMSRGSAHHDMSEPDCCTLKIIQFLGCNSLLPLRAELAVFDRQCRTATAIDIVALHLPTWHTVFIEVKTGYGGAINTPGCFTGHARSSKMRNALTGIDDTPLQRAAAQLLASYLLLVMGERYDRGSVVVGKPQEMYILHVNPHAIRPVRYAMPEWTFDEARRAAMYENMCAAARLEMQPPRALVTTACTTHHRQSSASADADQLPQMDSLMGVRKRRRATAEERELSRRRKQVQEGRALGLC